MTVYKPFRFGVLSGGASSRSEWRELARRAEELGYATLFIDDHFDNDLAPFAALAGK